MQRIQEFDGVRALAVALVILDHYAPFRIFANGWSSRYGGCGVDVFFVLSGFLITTILLKARSETHPYRVFYARRALRILPPFAILLVFVYGMAVLLHQPLNKTTLVGQVFFLRSFKGTETLLQHCLWSLHHPSAIPGLFHRLPQSIVSRDYGRYPMPASLGPTWSLSVEEWFYIGWAPVVLLFSRRAIAFTSAGVCAMGFLVRWLGGGGTSFLTSIDILVAGALLALWIEHRATLPGSTAKFADRCIGTVSALAALALFVLSWMHRDLISKTLIELAAFGGFAWLIRHRGERNPIAILLRWRPLAYIGSISYMIYLIHLPLYFVVRRMVDEHPAAITELERMWIVALFSIAATVLFAAASWKFCEEPILRQKEKVTALLKAATTRSTQQAVAPAEPLDLPEEPRLA